MTQDLGELAVSPDLAVIHCVVGGSDCGPGQRCVWDPRPPKTACVADTSGLSCNPDHDTVCGFGFQCASTDGTNFHCMPHCQISSECPSGQACTSEGDATVGFCFPYCNPLPLCGSCGDLQICTYGQNAWFPTCQDRTSYGGPPSACENGQLVGMQYPGARCSNGVDCSPGLFCYTDPTTLEGTCHYFCDATHPCPVGYGTCTSDGRTTPPSFSVCL